jgi:hypothetical protein
MVTGSTRVRWVKNIEGLMIKKRELEFPWMNLHHRVLKAYGYRLNQGQVGQSYRESYD